MWRTLLTVALIGLGGFLSARHVGAEDQPAKPKADAAEVEKGEDVFKDAEAVEQYAEQAIREIVSLARTKPDEATQKLAAFQARLDEAKDSVTDAGVKRAIARSASSVTALERLIDSGKKLIELVGKEAAPLKVEAWVNGEPLTNDDLKGKVVLLDFWAVWCGPCIATFPHLKEWNEKYADKGLVMIGLTRYYNMRWDEDKQRAVRATGDEKVAPAEEQEMLKAFAAHHGLEHRFAIQEGSDMSEYYGVTGIPHVVVIDQEGKVRMMRVGSGEANAKAIEELLEELLADK